MSEVKVNKISPRTACGTVTLGDSGDTFTIPAGATITNSGTAAGFGATGAVSWDTTAKTTGFTAVSGVGYFVNTTAGAITVTLPASPSAGAVVGVSDYAGTADTNNITIGRNGSNINGAAANQIISIENSAVTLVYVDGTQGWKATDTSNLNDIELQPTYVTATGGTITCSGDYRIHTFTGPGTFCVSGAGNPLGSTLVDYLVVAGGGGGGSTHGAGAGAGGYRESPGTASGSYSVSPLGAAPAVALPVSVQGYPIDVGGGGAFCGSIQGANGGNSNFSSITATGGGGGAKGCNDATDNGKNGGSGGGSATGSAASTIGIIGTGNTPPVSPSQGNNGGLGSSNATSYRSGGGGGGATAVGTGTPNPSEAANPGGAGATSINGTPTARAGGGGGGSSNAPGTGFGGAGGGGEGGYNCNPSSVRNGTTNTGGGGGGSGGPAPSVGGIGGSGIVIIRYKFQN